MQIKIDALKELMVNDYAGNYNLFARETGINVALLYRVLNNKANAGLKTINMLIDFLKKKDLKIEDYIFLP